jgi:hypothetical protein
VFRDWLQARATSEADLPDDGSGSGRPRRFDGDMLVHGEILSDFVRQSFLDPDDDRILDKILDAVMPGVGIPFREFMTREQARNMLKSAQAKLLQGAPASMPVSPQKRRQGARKRLAERPKSVAARVLRELKLAPKGADVSRLIPEARGSANLVAIIRLIHSEIDNRIGIEKGKRSETTADDAETTMAELDEIGDTVRERIRRAKREKEK